MRYVVSVRGHPASCRNRSWKTRASPEPAPERGVRDAMWNDADNARIIRDAIAIFGWQRCRFASNFPVAGWRVSYPVLLYTFARTMADLDEAARRAIRHDNATRVYRIASIA